MLLLFCVFQHDMALKKKEDDEARLHLEAEEAEEKRRVAEEKRHAEFTKQYKSVVPADGEAVSFCKTKVRVHASSALASRLAHGSLYTI